MSFLSQAIRPLRYDRTITSQSMEKQTTMFFDEINQTQTETAIQDRITLIYNADNNTLNWTTTGNSSYLLFEVKYNDITSNVSSSIKTFTLPTLTSNTFYNFQVSGLTSFGSLVKSNTVSIITSFIPPSNFTITANNITTSSFELVYSKTDGDATNFSFQPSIATTSLLSNTEYIVYATMTYEINGNQYTLNSNTITVLTLYIAPTINNFTNPITEHDEITLDFSVNFKDADLSNRILQIYKNNILLSSSDQNASRYIATSLIPNTQYEFQLKLQWYFNGVQQPSIDSPILTVATDTLNATNPFFDVQNKTSNSITIHNIDYGNDDGGTRLSNNIYLDGVLRSSTIQTEFTFTGLNEGQTYNIKITKTVQGVSTLFQFERNIATFINALPPTNNGSKTTLISQIPANFLNWAINTWGDQSPVSIQIIDASTATIITTLNATETVYYHTNLSQNTSYSYRIRKVYSAGYVESSTITLRTYHFAENDVINSIVMGFDEADLNIIIAQNNDAIFQSLEIQYKKSSDTSFTSQNISYGTTISGLQENTSYDFRLKKTTTILSQQFSNISAIYTTSTAHRPNAPTISLNTQTASSLVFNVGIGDMNDGVLQSVVFQVLIDTVWDTIETLTPTTTTVSLVGLKSATKYDVRLLKKYSFNSTTYNIISTSSGTTLYNPVISVSNIQFTNLTTNSLTITWTRNSDSTDPNVQYVVQYYKTSDITNPIFTESLNKSNLDVSNLEHNSEYTFIVHKYSFINNTETSTTVNTLDIVSEDILPSPPILTLGEIRSNQIDLTFTEEYNGTAINITFNIVYLDSANNEFVSPVITSPYTLTGLSSQETYRIRVRKSSSLGYVFSETKTATTPLPSQTLPLAVTVTSVTNHSDKSVVLYEPNSNGDATSAILEFYVAKQLTSTTWDTYLLYYETRDIISDISQGTFEYTALQPNTNYALKIKKVTNLIELETVFAIRTLDSGGSGGGGGGGLPFPFPLPKPNDGSDNPDDDPDDIDLNLNYLLKYNFQSGSLQTTYGLSELTHTGFTPYFYLNDPDTGRIYSFNSTQKYESTIDAVSFGVIQNSTELTMTFKIVVSSLEDYWRVKISNLEVVCDNNVIKLVVGGLLSYKEYFFTHTKPSPLFNE